MAQLFIGQIVTNNYKKKKKGVIVGIKVTNSPSKFNTAKFTKFEAFYVVCH